MKHFSLHACAACLLILRFICHLWSLIGILNNFPSVTKVFKFEVWNVSMSLKEKNTRLNFNIAEMNWQMKLSPGTKEIVCKEIIKVLVLSHKFSSDMPICEAFLKRFKENQKTYLIINRSSMLFTEHRLTFRAIGYNSGKTNWRVKWDKRFS